MNTIIDHHHYKKDLIPVSDRVARYERYMIDVLLNSPLPDSERDSSIAFELKHHHSTAQFAKLLAAQRNLSIDVCAVGALLHDLYVVQYGKYKDHAHKSAQLAQEVLSDLGGFSAEEQKLIVSLIYNHSDKEIWSDDPYIEIGKDADTLDSFLYHGAFGYYLKHKKLPIFYNYILRAKKIWNELNIPQQSCFQILDNYCSSWLNRCLPVSDDEANAVLRFMMRLAENTGDGGKHHVPLPTICFYTSTAEKKLYINETSLKAFETAVYKNFHVHSSLNQIDITALDSVFPTEPMSAVSEGARKLLQKSNNGYLIIWSALNAFEILQPENDFRRIKELGITID